MLNKIREARKNESGFTLIELLMVIVILGVLSGIVVFAVSGIQDRGALSACKSEVKTIAVAEEANYAQKGTYADLAGLVTNGFLRSGTPKYVASANASDGSLTLVASPPSGCSAA
ncbi:prepilin-type N-terminal cleavage/methylation domain-containing protein [Kribbella sp. NPDC050459]|uniref:type IV pilin protein n=1 Tax=Kribbella sp. NPDC050459 TaxID=3155785 RepID=UPI0033C32E9E